MVNVCVVYGCHNRSSKEVKRSFHAIPAVLTTQGEKTERLSAERRRLWISKIARKDWTPTKHSKVCSDHFVEGKPTALYNQNHPDWAPSLKLGLIRDDKPSTSSPVSLERMKDMIMWPDREQLRSTMPMEFRKNFGLKVAVIIDCFEIFTERPSDLLARAETWSNYKHHNTIKLLIGITPQGVVSYLSSAWGGRASDKMITESCDLLDRLLPGDLVLADRGFDIAESVGLQCAEVKIPAFTKGRKQLSPLEVQETRKIAHVRIHVERVIGLVRNKYTILKGTLPMDYMQNDEDEVPLIDKIVTVCCALTNLCVSVIPFN